MNTKVWYLPYSNANARMVCMVHTMVHSILDPLCPSNLLSNPLRLETSNLKFSLAPIP